MGTIWQFNRSMISEKWAFDLLNQSQSVLPEILKKFKNKTIKLIIPGLARL